MGLLSACMSVYQMSARLNKPEEGVLSPGTRVMMVISQCMGAGSWGHGCWVL